MSVVLNGMVGLMPCLIGIAYFTNIQLYEYFRFMDVYETMFTMFYIMLGDTVFDTFYGAR